MTQKADRRTRVDEIFRAFDRSDAPGCDVGVIREGVFVYRRGFGLASLEYEVPIGPHSTFHIASTSKQFTAMAILLLAEEGKLSLDDDVRGHLGELPYYGREMTIRHLLHHTSGLRDYTELAAVGRLFRRRLTDADVLQLLANQQGLNFPPGESFLYSNSNYFLLSQLVQRAAGESLAEYAERRIFAPLGMTNTHFHDDPTRVVKHLAGGYEPAPESGFRIVLPLVSQVGDGGLVTSVEDLLRWDDNFYENRLGERDPSLTQTMLSPGVRADGTSTGYGCGLLVDDYRGLAAVSHSGWSSGYGSEMLRFPGSNLTVVVLSNCADAAPWELAREVAEVYLGDLFQPIEPEAPDLEDRQSSDTEVVPPSRAETCRCVGTYHSDEFEIDYAFEQREGALVFIGIDGDLVPLTRRGRGEYVLVDFLFKFDFNDDEPATGFELDCSHSKGMRFTRRG